jgi:antitoxin component of RelBE/YafQ-DinJ toxin-antitoxin module
MSTITIKIDDNIHDEFKIKCVQLGKTQTEIFTEAVIATLRLPVPVKNNKHDTTAGA